MQSSRSPGNPGNALSERIDRVRKEIAEILDQYKVEEKEINWTVLLDPKNREQLEKIIDWDRFSENEELSAYQYLISYHDACVKLISSEKAPGNSGIVSMPDVKSGIKKSKRAGSDSSSPPTIHYIWAGGESKIPGHDIGGPIAMAEANKDNPRANPIVFWCLEKYKKHYEKKLQGRNIAVRSIESHIKEVKDDLNLRDARKKLTTIYDASIKGQDRGTIRDKVTLKVAFSYFLLQSIGGYVMDTNIIPKEEKAFTLPAKDKLSVPAIKNPEGPSGLECWMMYSPTAGNEQAKEIFDSFATGWRKTEIERKQLIDSGKTLENYHLMLGLAIIIPIDEVYRKGEVGLFETKLHKNNAFVDVHELNLQKTYNNTHRPASEERDKVSPMFSYVFENNIAQLRLYLRFGGNVNEIVDGSTPAFIAAELGYPDTLRTLAEFKADLNLPDENGQTPAWIAAEKGHTDTLRALAELKANLDIPDNEGQTPALMAAKNGHRESAELIQQHLFSQKTLRGLEIDNSILETWTPDARRAYEMLLLLRSHIAKTYREDLNVIPSLALQHTVVIEKALLSKSESGVINAMNALKSKGYRREPSLSFFSRQDKDYLNYVSRLEEELKASKSIKRNSDFR